MASVAPSTRWLSGFLPRRLRGAGNAEPDAAATLGRARYLAHFPTPHSPIHWGQAKSDPQGPEGLRTRQVGLRQACLAWWNDLSKRQVGPGADRAGRSCARQVKVAGQRVQPERPAPLPCPRGVAPWEAMRVGGVGSGEWQVEAVAWSPTPYALLPCGQTRRVCPFPEGLTPLH